MKTTIDTTNVFYNFESFCVDLTRRLLLRDGQTVPLPPKVFDTLIVLIKHRGAVIGKSELISAVWGDNIVEENNLSQNISFLRKALGESPDSHQFILTTPGTGYRFVARVMELSEGEASVYLETAARNNEPPVRTIAVLPFKTFGAIGAEEYLGLGLAEVLTTRLGKIANLKVRSISAARRHGGPGETGLAMGRRLRVESIVEGSIQRSGDRIRVTVHLLRVSDGTELWSEHFDERLSDIFAVEDRVSEQVVRALTLKLSGEEERQLTRHYTESSEAYQAYLKGRYFWSKRNEEGLQKGIVYFLQAIDSDPNYALAYSGLSDSYSMLGMMSYLPPMDLFPKAKTFALRAVELDAHLAEAHTSQALVLMDYDWNWAEARIAFERALSLNPNYATARQWYSELLLITEGPEAALTEARLALQLDPLSLTINRTLGQMLLFARRYDEAIHQLNQTLELDANFPIVHWALALAYAQKVKEVPIPDLSEMLRAASDPWSLASLGYVYGVSGRAGEARAVIDQLMEMSRKRYVSPGHFALAYAALGGEDDVMRLLESAYEERFTGLIFLNVDPSWEQYRSSRRFARLLSQLGF
jgi:DNA-binding winged helix-turn-helix (wHTH) protein